MGAAMYAATEADQSAAGGTDASTGAADDDVVDAEIVDEPGVDSSEGTDSTGTADSSDGEGESKWRPGGGRSRRTRLLLPPARSATRPERWRTSPRWRSPSR